MIQRQQRQKRSATLFPYTTRSRPRDRPRPDGGGHRPHRQGDIAALDDHRSPCAVDRPESSAGDSFGRGLMATHEVLAALADPTRLDVLTRLARSRSEEHTSELQSLMRISYAVFCLKKKTKHI